MTGPVLGSLPSVRGGAVAICLYQEGAAGTVDGSLDLRREAEIYAAH